MSPHGTLTLSSPVKREEIDNSTVLDWWNPEKRINYRFKYYSLLVGGDRRPNASALQPIPNSFLLPSEHNAADFETTCPGAIPSYAEWADLHSIDRYSPCFGTISVAIRA